MDPLTAVLMILVAVGYLGAIAYAITRIVKSEELSELEQWVWIAALVFFPVVSAIVWFAAGPHPFGLRLSRSIR